MAVYNINSLTGATILYPGDQILCPYSGGEKPLLLPKGKYLLECWGATGGYGEDVDTKKYGGSGGYSKGEITLNDPNILYLNCGQKGQDVTVSTSSFYPAYNGGGQGAVISATVIITVNASCGGGGGATHISFQSGLLRNLSDKREKIILVAGGGGGGYIRGILAECDGGVGGGSSGTVSANITHSGYTSPGTQTGAGYGGGFGYGGNTETVISTERYRGGAGGGGWYGGSPGYENDDGGGGGSGYFNPSLLTNGSTDVGYIVAHPTGDSNGCIRITVREIFQPHKNIYSVEEVTSQTRLFKDDIINCSYSGGEKSITLPKGRYRLECWGASGGDVENNTYWQGSGGYSIGEYKIYQATKLYLNVGGHGKLTISGDTTVNPESGGYNGGGYAQGIGMGDLVNYRLCGGGGATHIALSSGILSTFESKKNDVLIAAGGGGGGGPSATSSATLVSGGIAHGGGISGASSGVYWLRRYNFTAVEAQGGTQNSGGVGAKTFNGSTKEHEGLAGTFGQGGSADHSSGGGGGWYGGGGGAGSYGFALLDYWATLSPGGGGSGHINNNYIIDGHTYREGEIAFVPPDPLKHGYIRITVLDCYGLDMPSNINSIWEHTIHCYFKNEEGWPELKDAFTNINGTWTKISSS